MTVLNKHSYHPMPDDIYIGRPSKFGNPFIIGRDGDRAEVVKKYRSWLWYQLQSGKISVDEVKALHGKRLVCWCAPLACHGDVLVAAAKFFCEG